MKNTLKKLGFTRNEILQSPALFQTHFGDYLKKEIQISEEEKYRIYQTHEENLPYTNTLLTIEYFGQKNGFTWTTINTYK